MIRGYFGHPKAGSTWLSGVFLDLSFSLGLRTFYGQLPLFSNEQIFENNPEMLISQNTSYELLKDLQDYKGVHVIRDPRDICTSSYFSYRYSHAIDGWHQLAELRESLESKTEEQGMFDIIDFNYDFFRYMSDWNYQDPNILELKFEILVQHPKETILDMFKFLDVYDNQNSHMSYRFGKTTGYANRVFAKFGINSRIHRQTINATYVDELCKKLSFERLSKGRKKGEHDNKSHYRSGKAGDWQNHLNQDHLDYLNEQHPGLLQKLNYS